MKKLIISVILGISLFWTAPSVSAVGGHLYFAPSEGTFFIGSTFDVSVFLDTGENDVNAVEVNIKFDPSKIQVASPTAGKSFISVWIAQPTYSNTEGTMTFRGGVPSPGINTSAGLVSTITFRAVAIGRATISFADSSKVLLNDGKGTNILTSVGRGTYSIVIPPPEGPKIFSPTHQNPERWYKNNNPTFSWDKEEGVVDFSYTLDRDPFGVPDNTPEGDQASVSYGNLGDGIWYFHLKARKDSTWGGISHFPVQIDSSPPAAFSPTVDPAEETIERQPLVFFITTDSFSGTDHYELKSIDVSRDKEESATGFFIEVASPYRLPHLEIGRYLVVVRAYDAAGNYQEGKVKIQIYPEGIFLTEKGVHFWGILIVWPLVFLLILIVLIILIGAMISVIKRYRESRRRRWDGPYEVRKRMEDYRQEIYKEIPEKETPEKESAEKEETLTDVPR